MNIIVPGQLAGVHSMDNKYHFTSAVAFTDSVLYFFSHERFNELIKTYPELVGFFTETLIKEIQILLEEISFNSLSAEQQIGLLLSNLSKVYMHNEIPMKQRELAAFTGLNRITIYKILKKWKEDGVIEMKNHKIHIQDTEYFRVHLKS
ncbi:Crp/Fnr family transcriptional regulator [Cohnella silvisoli]|uniref:Crp/Fnr family transcriptional regulator n=1 Tax=Cohnella silvisoli TaxID=2873699 RepID=A0ABV1L3D8_9BACL|nr:Crp/Fnr family transcriptional regulator [Cohnella silvisoli]MCD9026155.1 Crp/Fnr family transcriptional regulator [Cohnella silvisoli]